MAKSGMHWVRPPQVLVIALDDYSIKVLRATEAVAEFVGLKMQNYARKEARWTDRTGNARSGLFYLVRREAARRVVNLYLSHTMEYGIHLEINHGGRFAIIWETIETHLAEIKRMLDGIFK